MPVMIELDLEAVAIAERVARASGRRKSEVYPFACRAVRQLHEQDQRDLFERILTAVAKTAPGLTLGQSWDLVLVDEDWS